MVLHSKRYSLYLYRIKINRDSNEVISLSYVVENIYPEVQSVEPLMIGLLLFYYLHLVLKIFVFFISTYYFWLTNIQQIWCRVNSMCQFVIFNFKQYWQSICLDISCWSYFLKYLLFTNRKFVLYLQSRFCKRNI